MLTNVFIIGTCGFINYYKINNYSGLEMNHLQFLEWCRAYRIAKCQLEFSGREEREYSEVRYNEMRYYTQNRFNPVEHYNRILEMATER